MCMFLYVLAKDFYITCSMFQQFELSLGYTLTYVSINPTVSEMEVLRNDK